MKKSILFCFAFVAGCGLFLAGCGGEAVPRQIAVFPFSTAVIQYDLSGAAAGEESLFIKGDFMASHRFVTQAGQEENALELNLGPEKYLANLDKMTAIKVKNEDYEILTKLNKDEQLKHMIRNALGLRGTDEIPAPAGTKTIAGQTCEVYLIETIGSACIWNGIVLEKTVSILGIANDKVAVSVRLNTDIANDRFELPAGIIITN